MEELENQIRQYALAERLETAKRMISAMCAEGRPPKMSVPAQATDEDLFITVTLQDAGLILKLALALEIERTMNKP